jgi:octaprenyl-diphosphate synthase
MTYAQNLDELYAPVQAELAQVRGGVNSLWAEALALVDGGASAALPGASGKLLRPAMCLMAAGAAGASSLDTFIPLATACELLHMAALTHDDIVDKANLRRGSMSLNALWDDRTAVLSGDYLVARSVGLLLGLQSCPLIEDMFKAVRKMTEGELRSIGMRGNHLTAEDCIRLAEEKTATYFAATCTAPTHVCGTRWREPLNSYGMALGIAFQLVDDILDLVQDEKTLGKPSCGDIAEGKKTLPILLMHEALDEGDRAAFDAMSGKPVAETDRAWIAGKLAATGARERAEKIARGYASTAREALSPLPPSKYKDSMLGLAEFILIRGS